MIKKIILITIIIFLVACSLPAGGISTFQPIATNTNMPLVTSSTPIALKIMGRLNLRSWPDATKPDQSNVIATMPLGSTAIWIGICSGKWAKVKYGEKVGWAYQDYFLPKVCP